MRPRSQGGAVVRQARRLAMVMAFVLAATAGALVAPSPAMAQIDPPWRIPPNGWCYHSWYTVTTNDGVQHVRHRDVPVLSFSNGTSTPATWSEQFTFSKTHRSTITTNTRFEGGIDLGVIRIGVQHSTQTVTVSSVTVTHTTGFSTTVLPFSTKFAQYGTWRLVVSGNYVQSKHECGTWNYETVTSGQVTASLVLADDPVGWRLWE